MAQSTPFRYISSISFKFEFVSHANESLCITPFPGAETMLT